MGNGLEVNRYFFLEKVVEIWLLFRRSIAFKRSSEDIDSLSAHSLRVFALIDRPFIHLDQLLRGFWVSLATVARLKNRNSSIVITQLIADQQF